MIGEDEDRRGEVTPGPPFCGGGETRNATPIGGIHSHLLRERGDDIPIILDHEGKAAVNMLKCGCMEAFSYQTPNFAEPTVELVTMTCLRVILFSHAKIIMRFDSEDEPPARKIHSNIQPRHFRLRLQRGLQSHDIRCL
jgi:hypothetical protein